MKLKSNIEIELRKEKHYTKVFFCFLETKKTRKNAIVEYLDYQIPVTQLMGPKRNGDMQAAKID